MTTENSPNAINLIFCEIPYSGNLLYLERSQKMHLSSALRKQEVARTERGREKMQKLEH